MALPTSYLTSYKNVGAILQSIQNARAPERFTVKFLQDLGYASAADRLFIKMFKTFGFLRESGEPTQIYHEFLDPSQSGQILADALRGAYSDLFQINRNANRMSPPEVRAKFKTISQGAYSDDVLGKMANTFDAFVKTADFSSQSGPLQPIVESEEPTVEEVPMGMSSQPQQGAVGAGIGVRLAYDIHLHLPATRDPSVYDALFASLTKHLRVQ